MEKKTSYVLPTSTLYTDHIVFDDGSWGTKGRRLATDTGAETFYNQLAIVATNDVDSGDGEFSESGMDNHIVEIPGQVFGCIVGPGGLHQRRATFEVSKMRYTSPAATYRFYACLGTLLGDRREATIHLTVGANDEVVHEMRNNIRGAFDNLDTQGTPQPHRFTVDGREYRVTVARTCVVGQSIAAAKSIRVNPPVTLAARLEEQPLHESTIIVFDGGGMSMDVSVLHPSRKRGSEGKLVLAQPTFSAMKGTNEMKLRLGRYIEREVGHLPNAVELESRTDPRLPHLYGWYPTLKKKLDLLPAMADIRKNVWNEIWLEISGKINNITPTYVFAVGGMAIVAREEIENTVLIAKSGKTLRLGDFSGFAIPENPHLAVPRGMAALGDEDAARQV